MWICLTDAFVSVVRYRPSGPDDDRRSHLLVRARMAGDLERLLGPSVAVTELPTADYRFRAVVQQEDLFGALVRRLMALSYENFKDEVHAQPRSRDPYRDVRHRAYGDVWSVMAGVQSRLHGAPWSGRLGLQGDLEMELADMGALSRDELAWGDACPDCGEAEGFCLCYQGSERAPEVEDG